MLKISVEFHVWIIVLFSVNYGLYTIHSVFPDTRLKMESKPCSLLENNEITYKLHAVLVATAVLIEWQ